MNPRAVMGAPRSWCTQSRPGSMPQRVIASASRCLASALPSGHHPGHYEAAVEVQHHVEAQERSLNPGSELGDVPGPNLVGCLSHKAWHRVMMLGPLHPALARFAALGQQPVHGADRAKILSLVEELGKHLCGGLISKARLVQRLEHGLAFEIAQARGLRLGVALGLTAFGPACR
jgi:hypothetical protein